MADPYADLSPTFAASLRQLISAAPSPLSIVSGYRSPEHQAELYAAALQKYGSEREARRWVAPPGHSMHGKGEAVDLGFGGGGLGGGDRSLIDWTHQHAGEYGLTFPLSNENWHIEPMGARAQMGGSGPVPATTTASASVPGAPGGAVTAPGAPTTPLDGLMARMPQPVNRFAEMLGMPSATKTPESDWLNNSSYSSDAILSDMFAGRSPLKRAMYQGMRSLFAGV